MIPRTRFRKTLLLVGGSGELGKAINYRFSQTWFKRWNVFNIDSTPNPLASHNFLVDFNAE